MSVRILPIPQAELNQHVLEAKKACLDSYVQKLGRFREEQIYVSQLDGLERDLSGEAATFESSNKNDIGNLLEKAQSTAVQTFVVHLSKFQGKAQTSVELTKIRNSALSEANTEFDKIAMWAADDIQAEGIRTTLNELYEDRFNAFCAANNLRVSDAIKGTVQNLKDRLGTELDNLASHIPTSTDNLMKLATQQEDDILKELEIIYGEFSGLEAIDLTKKELHQFFMMRMQTLKESNMNAIKRYVNLAMKEASRKLVADRANYYFIYAFRDHAKDIVTKELQTYYNNNELLDEAVHLYLETEFPKMTPGLYEYSCVGEGGRAVVVYL
eukprot:TRINITY_DN2990_c0_g1_i9.p1 TRINITY_DN2990_c0_g1~~TRINITY_DN2990_c0_g1_i9.p1  ORF type:complete len:327 (-),score=87.11 TRINITY_DN2990_c0_g1_i9:348-1328(-)